ncbi:MAG: DUF4349 domain-containing protein [Mobilitalea sp.]
MNKRRLFSLVGLMLIMMLVVSACAKSSKDGSKSDNSTGSDYDMGAPAAEPELAYDSSTDSANEEDKAEANGDAKGGVSNTSVINTDETPAQALDKIIRRFMLEVETQEFDSLITKIDSEIGRLGGYVENSKISGKPIYYNNEARYGSIVVRIPRDKVDEFVSVVEEEANVVNNQESTENVTLQYTDMESRKKSLEIEQERLFVLLEKAVTLENVITLESRLSEIRYELQSYETQLRTYDNLVEYSTVTLSIQEVERMTPVIEEKQSVGDRIKNGFNDSIYDLSEGFKNFFVWFVVNIPYLLIWAVIIIVTVIVIRRYFKKKYRKSIIPPSQGPKPPVA